ncbi:tail completion protein gp17 [Erwinia billingiae]|uniref:tail completion protein gp17 n=1 Tax=Erwinia billingiae TaxID=182337 RepID=UPI0012458284|nr:DUF3168 domain-containing protein [Erwinia billingiae]MCX0499738.1 DUF3168 domain-containing protein [Erwinia billingiae]QEW32024.1 DUF3168 domain-containing protein [Erwinia billingiae]
MIAPIFPVCAASAAVVSLLGNSPVRLYPFGLNTDSVVYPYAVWQNISGGPENFLSGRPDADNYTLQVDMYADTAEEVIAVARALRDAIEPHAYITRWGDQGLDSETKRYRYSFDVDWIVSR